MRINNNLKSGHIYKVIYDSRWTTKSGKYSHTFYNINLDLDDFISYIYKSFPFDFKIKILKISLDENIFLTKRIDFAIDAFKQEFQDVVIQIK
jgi:hypothetical protein